MMLQRSIRRLSMAFPRTFSTAAQNTAAPLHQDPTQAILTHALHHVNTSGWTVDSLANGARDAGYPSVAHGMFPRGAVELVEYFMDDVQRQVQDKLAAETEDLPVTDRLKRGIQFRLQILSPFLPLWPQAMALGALPQNAPTTMKKLAEMIDDIWVYAGDRSTDLSWYTKRAVLTGVYTSTELFMLTDQSPNYEETWRFLDRRIEEVIALGELPNNAQDVAGMVSIGIQSILSTATALAGPLTHQVVSQVGQQLPNPLTAIPSPTVNPRPPSPTPVTPSPEPSKPLQTKYPEL